MPYKGYCSELLVTANLASSGAGCQENGVGLRHWGGLGKTGRGKSIRLMAGKPTAVLQTEL